MNSWLAKTFKIVVLIVFIMAILGTAVMWLWNWLMPDLFNLPTISFTQALGLTILSRILTGGFRWGVGSSSQEQLAQKMQLWDKWSNMTPEERQKWRDEWRSRCKSNPSNKVSGDEES